MLRRLGLGALIASALAAAAIVASGAAAQPAAGKPVAPFAIEHGLDAPPRLGVPLEISLTLRPRMPVEAVDLMLSADEGLALDASDERLTAPAAAPDAPAEWRIAVLPLAEGVQRLRVYAEAAVGGQRQGRSTVITLRVGAAAEAVRYAKEGASPSAAAKSLEPDRSSGDGTGRDGERRMIRLPSSERR